MQKSLWQIEKIPQKLREYFEPAFERQATKWQRPEAGNIARGRDPKTGERKGIITPPRNPHPTVKPIALTRWLATLLLPPPDYAPRRILIPFCGSGSEAIGAGLAGWDEILGIEMMPEYVEIAQARLAHWLARVQMEMEL